MKRLDVSGAVRPLYG